MLDPTKYKNNLASNSLIDLCENVSKTKSMNSIIELIDILRKMKSMSSSVELCEIVHEMRRSGVLEDFIVKAFKTALQYPGVADLFILWRDEADQAERDEIIADIQELVDDCQQRDIATSVKIQMNDLDAIAKDIRLFKDSLLEIVNEKGGITNLAKQTGIPQPSLSRFFNSNAMPRRATLLKIARALGLNEIDINSPWVS